MTNLNPNNKTTSIAEEITSSTPLYLTDRYCGVNNDLKKGKNEVNEVGVSCVF